MKILLLVLCLLVAGALGYWGLNKANTFVVKGMLLSELTRDLSDFYADNQRLPENWSEFASWAEKHHTERNWQSDLPELNSKFALKWGAKIQGSAMNPEAIFMVIDPDFKDIEGPLNNRLYALCEAKSQDSSVVTRENSFPSASPAMK